ncbi:MAG TPA: DNA polymerase III subunit chi [Gammaproteobacteria bacterium]|nr:DNA polymerase III subunit chi [Gammaproteobacteria bacterium]
MTRVDFYILEQPTKEARLTLACRIAEKAVQSDHEVLINAESDTDCARLDGLLWTFSQGSFLPHRLLSHSAASEGEPVLIGSGQEPEDGRWDLLINLAPDVPDFFGRFGRVAELVGAEEDARAAGRERFRYYRDRGYELRTHHV